jgi:hypothetical protein
VALEKENPPRLSQIQCSFIAALHHAEALPTNYKALPEQSTGLATIETIRAMADGSLDSQVGARICNGLGIMRACLETATLERVEERLRISFIGRALGFGRRNAGLLKTRPVSNAAPAASSCSPLPDHHEGRPVGGICIARV